MSLDLSVIHLQRAIQCKTVSYHDRSQMDFKEFEKFIQQCEIDYPVLHASSTKELIGGYSLLFKIKGSTNEPPIGMMGHYDVVPAAEHQWDYNPFAGEIDQGYIYGRGSLDMKGHVIALLEAVEQCLAEGVTFKRDLYIMLGHNEETGSKLVDSGARAIRDYLMSKGVHFAMVIDEGGAFIDGSSLGIDGTIALVGIGEKGYCDVVLTATQSGGHASMPPHRSALTEVFEAGIRCEKRKNKANFNPATEAMFNTLVPYMKQPFQFLIKNRHLLKPLLLYKLTQSIETAAILRTTCVMTQASGSLAPNVLAQKGMVTLNNRIIPGESVDFVIDRISKIVGPKIEVTSHNGTEPTSISPTDNDLYLILNQTIKSHFPQFKAIAPYLLIGATDSRLFHNMADGVYRIACFESVINDLHTIHADNERLSISSFIQGIEFFKTLITNLTNH